MILAMDTATRWAGLALHDSTAVVAELGWRCFNTHTIELAPAVIQMLAQANVAPADLAGVAVAIGPGSYTGLRVGLALAKGLALANHLPLIGVPTLDVVAAAFGPLDGQLLVAAEAGRSRVCATVYHWQQGRWQATGDPVIETWENILAEVQGATTFAGEITPEIGRQIRAANKAFRLASPAASARRAGYLAELAWERLRQGQVDDAATLAPIYLRDPAGS